MEEGPEPHEGVERMVEHHHHEHGHEGEGKNRDTLMAASTAAVLAVCAAIGSLLSGHAANEAVLKQSKANDAWAYYQAKSTKGHLYESDQKLIKALADLQHLPSQEVAAKLDVFQASVAKYNDEKKAIQAKAAKLDAESEHQLARHTFYSYGVAAFQVGIVLSSIFILVRYRTLYFLSLVAGGVGVVLVLCGAFAREPPAETHSQEEARLSAPFHPGPA
jgi:hypothetical protein